MLRSPGGKKRGKQPLWLSTILRYYIQPVVKRLSTNKRVTSHTFRRTYTTLLHANGEGADARKTGGTAESGGDGAVGKASVGG
jgi:integrase